jgi:hypothetical protein
MTRGIFDPNSENVSRGAGNDFLGEQGINRSKMPPDLIDEKADEGNADAADAADAADIIDDEVQPTFNDNPDAAADSLMHIEVEDEGQVDLDEAEEPRQVE